MDELCRNCATPAAKISRPTAAVAKARPCSSPEKPCPQPFCHQRPPRVASVARPSSRSKPSAASCARREIQTRAGGSTSVGNCRAAVTMESRSATNPWQATQEGRCSRTVSGSGESPSRSIASATSWHCGLPRMAHHSDRKGIGRPSHEPETVLSPGRPANSRHSISIAFRRLRLCRRAFVARVLANIFLQQLAQAGTRLVQL